MTDAEAIQQKHRLSEATKKRNPHLFAVAGLGSPEPQHREVQTLARSLPQQAERQESPRTCRVLIVRYGRKRLDDDNLVAAFKAVRDAIAENLGVDDGSEAITFDYRQIISKTTGTHILISI